MKKIYRELVVTLPLSEMTKEEYDKAIEVISGLSTERLNLNRLTYYPETSSNNISDSDRDVLMEKGIW